MTGKAATTPGDFSVGVFNAVSEVAATASDMGFRWEMTKSFALIGRTEGALGHIQEEIERPMVERIKEAIAARVEYDGDK